MSVTNFVYRREHTSESEHNLKHNQTAKPQTNLNHNQPTRTKYNKEP
jgi:hypothetical protein